MKVQKLDAQHNTLAALSVQRIAQLSAFSERITYRLARTYLERDAIFKHRYSCFLRTGSISPNCFGRHIESVDHETNSYLLGLYVDRRLISSLRVQVGTAKHANFVSAGVFPKILEPLIESNKTVVDMSGVATDGELAQPYRWMPYLILRAWILTAENFQADYLSTSVPPQHQMFYQRVLNCEAFSELRSLPRRSTSVGLITLNFLASAERLYKDLPFLRSTVSERQNLFEKEAIPSKARSNKPSAS